jgi:nitrate reductase (NAD(P)H)
MTHRDLIRVTTLTLNAECNLGILTDKAKQFIQKNAEKVAKEKSKFGKGNEDLALQKHR